MLLPLHFLSQENLTPAAGTAEHLMPTSLWTWDQNGLLALSAYDIFFSRFLWSICLFQSFSTALSLLFQNDVSPSGLKTFPFKISKCFLLSSIFSATVEAKIYIIFIIFSLVSANGHWRGKHSRYLWWSFIFRQFYPWNTLSAFVTHTGCLQAMNTWVESAGRH